MASLNASSRLCIDGRMLGPGGTGVSTYTRTLVAAAAMLSRPHGLLHATPRLGWTARMVSASLPGHQRLKAKDADLTAADIFRVSQAHFNLRGKVLRLSAPGAPGVMHWSYPVPIMIEGWANLYTIHDLIPLTHPDLTPIDPVRHRRLLAAIQQVADRCVTVSEAARAEIVGTLDWPADRVVNCGQAILQEADGAPLPPGNEPRGYLLFCGRIEARKNLTRLIEAHARSGVQMPLHIVGPVAEGGAMILEEGARSNPLMRYSPYVDRPTLIALMANARAVLLPSLVEGFGLPVAEAMTLGTPTLISRDPALVETAGGAALIVDEGNIGAMADGINRLSRDDALTARLTDAGRKRAESFTVDRFAERLHDLYAAI